MYLCIYSFSGAFEYLLHARPRHWEIPRINLGRGLARDWPLRCHGRGVKKSVPVLTKRHMLSESREGGHLRPVPGTQALLFCSMYGPAEADLAGCTVQGQPPSCRQLGPITLPTPPQGPVSQTGEAHGFNQALVGMNGVFSVVLFPDHSCGPCWHVAQKKKDGHFLQIGKSLSSSSCVLAECYITSEDNRVARIHMPLCTRIEKVLQRFLRMNH